jgi:hypothetical protein
MSASTVTIKAAEDSAVDDSANDNSADDEPTIPVFIPSLDFVTGVPPDLLPPIFPTDDPFLRLGLGDANRGTGVSLRETSSSVRNIFLRCNFLTF